MLEMEREVSDLLIIAHESVLRVLCAYFMENSADVRPFFVVLMSSKFHSCRSLGMRLWRLFQGLIRVRSKEYISRGWRRDFLVTAFWEGDYIV
jgi:hypothetical protein